MRVTSSQKKGGKTSRKKIEKYDEVSIQNDLQEDSKPFGDSEMKHQNNDLELEQDDGHSSSVEGKCSYIQYINL